MFMNFGTGSCIEPRLLDAAQNDIGLVPEAIGGLAQFIVEMGDTLAAQVLQFHPFQVVPDPLSWVQRLLLGRLASAPSGRGCLLE
jgi:hypothetical protein